MNKGTDTILVTGITGQQGGSVAKKLLANGHKVRGLTRKPDSEHAKEFAARGAEIIKGDLDDAASLERALSGAWGVFAVQNTWEAGVQKEEEQGKRIANLAKNKGVQHFVYASVGSAHRNTGIPHFDNKWRVEQEIRRLGFASQTILRPVFFMDNFASPWFKPGLQDGKLAIALQASTKLQMISVDDIGKFGLLAFEHHAHLNGRAIDIAGDEVSMPEAAAVLSKVAGRKIDFVQLPIDAVRKMSEDYASMLEWFDSTGYDVHVPSMASDYHVRTTTFSEWASANKSWR